MKINHARMRMISIRVASSMNPVAGRLRPGTRQRAKTRLQNRRTKGKTDGQIAMF
jgi:hypothetical protein